MELWLNLTVDKRVQRRVYGPSSHQPTGPTKDRQNLHAEGAGTNDYYYHPFSRLFHASWVHGIIFTVPSHNEVLFDDRGACRVLEAMIRTIQISFFLIQREVVLVAAFIPEVYWIGHALWPILIWKV